MNRRAFIAGTAAAAVAVPVAALAAKLPPSPLRGGELFIGGKLVGSFKSVSFERVQCTNLKGDVPLYAELVRYPEVKFVWVDENGREFSKEVQ